MSLVVSPEEHDFLQGFQCCCASSGQTGDMTPIDNRQDIQYVNAN